MSDNPLRYGSGNTDNMLSPQWAPSAWRPGQPPTGEDVDLSSRPNVDPWQSVYQNGILVSRRRLGDAT